uniref:SAC domain-containing protein n=1 Tax=Acrobeloides nanus TaxID=290746 RepID=A0A914CYK7_9BILA
MRLCSISVYETASHFYIIGSDAAEAKFSVLKVDRTAERDFVVGEPDHEYSKADVAELLSTISSSSIVTQSDTYYGAQRSGHNTLVQTINKAYGLIGAIRFLEGYYLLIVTKARVVAALGHHAIYKIEDVSMIYIPNSPWVYRPANNRVTLFKISTNVDREKKLSLCRNEIFETRH